MTRRLAPLTAPPGPVIHDPVVLSVASLPRYLFTGRFFQVLLHLPNFARLYWRLFRDRRVSILPKALLVLTLLYVLSPLDIVPDFIPGIGEVDDVVVVLAGLWLFIRLCPPEAVRQTVHDIAHGRNAPI